MNQALSMESLDQASLLSRDLEEISDVGERLRVVVNRFPGRVIASTSFGAQSPLMLHLLKEHAPEVPIIFIDTGYLFRETYHFAEQLIKRWDLNLRVYQPQLSAARQEALYGKLWEQGEGGIQKYSLINKVEPMNRAIKELNAAVWISGLRRAQSKSREEREFAEQQKQTLKVYPIIDWSDDQVVQYLSHHQLPTHPLIYQGYVSIGDWHSTKPLAEGMTPEETRFDGVNRECGLHIPSTQPEYQI